MERASTADKRPVIFLSADDLKHKKGLPYSKATIHRLINAGRFPRPVKVGANRNAWVEREIDDHLEALAAADRTPQPQKQETTKRAAQARWGARHEAA